MVTKKKVIKRKSFTKRKPIIKRRKHIVKVKSKKLVSLSNKSVIIKKVGRKTKGNWDDDPKDIDDKKDDLENISDYPIKKAIRERREAEKERETESRKEIGRRYREARGY